jgi:ankyrin repeat protein
MAAAGGHAEVVKALLAAGANVHTTEKVSEEGRGK